MAFHICSFARLLLKNENFLFKKTNNLNNIWTEDTKNRFKVAEVEHSEIRLVRSARDCDFSYQLSEVRTIKIEEYMERTGEIARNEQFLLFPQCL